MNEPLPEQSPADAKTVAGIAALLMVEAGTSSTATSISTVLTKAGIPVTAARRAAMLGLSTPLAPQGRRLSRAVAASERADYTYRAAWILASSRRIAAAIREGQQLTSVMSREKDLFKRHLDAQKKRLVSSRSVDLAAAKYGDMLGWYTTIDAKTSPECRAANKHNFRVDTRPWLGYPGAVHPDCRCVPGKPFRGAGIIPSVAPRSSRRSA